MGAEETINRSKEVYAILSKLLKEPHDVPLDELMYWMCFVVVAVSEQNQDADYELMRKLLCVLKHGCNTIPVPFDVELGKAHCISDVRCVQFFSAMSIVREFNITWDTPGEYATYIRFMVNRVIKNLLMLDLRARNNGIDDSILAHLSGL